MLLCSRHYANQASDQNNDNPGISLKPRYADDGTHSHKTSILAELVELEELTWSANSGSGGTSSGTGGYTNGGFTSGGGTTQSGGGGGGSSGAMIGGSSIGQSGCEGGSSGDMIGVGSTGQTVDRNLFCNTGMIYNLQINSRLYGRVLTHDILDFSVCL